MAHKKNKKSERPFRFEGNIKKCALHNKFFRRVVLTAKYSQLATVNILKGEETLKERQEADIMVFIVKGKGKLKIEGQGRNVVKHDFVFVPAGKVHSLANAGRNDLKAIVVYSPPAFADGTIQKTPREFTAEKQLAYEYAWEQ